MVVAKPSSDRVVLHPISWRQFERLLEDLGDRRGVRIAIQQLPDLIEKHRLAGRRAIRRAVRAWVQQH